MALATKSSRRVISALGAIALGAPLAACSADLTRTFGFTRDSPDEFTVTTQAPLTIPPDYTIRPPRPGAPRPQDVPDQVAAQEALIPQTALAPGSDSAALSPGQQALIQQAGPPAPADIRTQIAQEQSQLNGNGQSFAERLMFWRSSQPEGIAVDPTKEAQRLRENAALGQSPTVGQTPIIQPKPKGWLEGIF
jgi:Protein of unknown function (DUF3035)